MHMLRAPDWKRQRWPDLAVSAADQRRLFLRAAVIAMPPTSHRPFANDARGRAHGRELHVSGARRTRSVDAAPRRRLAPVDYLTGTLRGQPAHRAILLLLRTLALLTWHRTAGTCGGLESESGEVERHGHIVAS